MPCLVQSTVCSASQCTMRCTEYCAFLQHCGQYNIHDAVQDIVRCAAQFAAQPQTPTATAPQQAPHQAPQHTRGPPRRCFFPTRTLLSHPLMHHTPSQLACSACAVRYDMTPAFPAPAFHNCGSNGMQAAAPPKEGVPGALSPATTFDALTPAPTQLSRC